MLLAHALDGEGSPLAKKSYRQWRKALLKDKITQVIAHFGRRRTLGTLF
jgi:hypothetical protein